MNGSVQLAQLARLLHISSDTARHIARTRVEDAAEIHWIAHQIEELADQVQEVIGFQLEAPALLRSARPR